jgi:hypothetical protein
MDERIKVKPEKLNNCKSLNFRFIWIIGYCISATTPPPHYTHQSIRIECCSIIGAVTVQNILKSCKKLGYAKSHTIVRGPVKIRLGLSKK